MYGRNINFTLLAPSLWAVVEAIASNVEEEKYKRVCLGVSNKRFSSKLFENIDDNELTIISSAISSFASYSGVEFLRVHDIEANHAAVEVSWKTFTS